LIITDCILLLIAGALLFTSLECIIGYNFLYSIDVLNGRRFLTWDWKVYVGNNVSNGSVG